MKENVEENPPCNTALQKLKTRVWIDYYHIIFLGQSLLYYLSGLARVCSLWWHHMRILTDRHKSYLYVSNIAPHFLAWGFRTWKPQGCSSSDTESIHLSAVFCHNGANMRKRHGGGSHWSQWWSAEERGRGEHKPLARGGGEKNAKPRQQQVTCCCYS